MNMSALRMTLPVLALAVAGSDAAAQGARFNCEKEPVPIESPGDRLDMAVAQLQLATRRPISGTKLAKGKRSRPLVGTIVPEAAVQAMLSGTGLQSRKIRGGFQVVRLPRR